MDANYQLAFTSSECLNLVRDKITLASKSIDIEAFYFLNDDIGSEILNILIEKAQKGVEIRIMLDHVGSYGLSGSKAVQELVKNNIDVRFFNSIIPFSKNRKTFWYFRNHRRTIIIDREYVFTGSMCFGLPTKDWLETGIFIKDKDTVEKALAVFNKTWIKVYRPTFKIGSTARNVLYDQYDFTYITQSPMQFKMHIYGYYLEAIEKSKESIHLVSPYFVPTRTFVNHLLKAAKRQVQIHIILPKKTDWTIVDIARNTYIRKLLRNGIHVYFHNQMVHSKIALFDGKEAFLGTSNLDNLSMLYNYECGFKVLNKQCVSEIKRYITSDLRAGTTKIDLDSWEERSFLLKMLEKIVKLFRKFL